MPVAPPPRKEFSYLDAMSESLHLYLDNVRSFLLLSFAGAALFILKTILDGTGAPLCQAAGYMIAPLAFGLGTLMYMALIFAVSKRCLKEPVSFSAAFQAVLPKFWRAVIAALVFTIVLILGTVLFVVPGVYWLTVIYFFMYLIVIEDKKLWDSFEASAALVKGSFWKVLGAHGLVMVVALAFLMPFYLGMWLIGVPVAWRDALFQVLGVFLMPFSAAFYYQLYIWLKEKEKRAGHIAVIEIA